MNLTGDNIQTVLDNLLYRALHPIIMHTRIFDVQIQHVLARITINKKRKLVSIDRSIAISLLCKALIETDRNKKFTYITQSKIERSIVHRFVSNLLLELDAFAKLYVQNITAPSQTLELKCKAYARYYGCEDYNLLYVMYNQINDFINEYYKYRNSVVDLYIKFSYKVSNNFRSSKTSVYDSDDMFQNFLSAVTKAIDKYDSSKGALTSYINYWILNAKTCNSASSEYGIAYTIPHSKKKEKVNDKRTVNFSVSLDHEDIDSIESVDDVHSDTERAEENSIVQYLIKRVDKRGCLRLTLDIDEYYSKRELAKMRKNCVH